MNILPFILGAHNYQGAWSNKTLRGLIISETTTGF